MYFIINLFLIKDLTLLELALKNWNDKLYSKETYLAGKAFSPD